MNKTLVTYFSASGNTEKVAKKLNSLVKGDLFEIVPKNPYTSSDLDWTNKNSRSSIEMNDKNFRPEISQKVKDIEQYDIIYVGFPIWWYVAPNTFLESYDLTNKTIIPFATSGGSGMGNTNKELITSCKGATLKEGKRFSSNVSENELIAWLKTIE